MSNLAGKTVCIFGNSRCSSEDHEYREAEQLGRLLAEARVTVCTGGYDGVMEAASRTAYQGGGEVIGVTADIFSAPPNQYLSRELRAPDLFGRLKTLAEMADGFIGLRGGIGTLTEVALMWNLLVLDSFNSTKPFLLIGSGWQRVVDALAKNLAVDDRDLPHVTVVQSAQEALTRLETMW